jgi:hypothetical protein
MEICKGFENWLECLGCPHLCTKRCPIENENVMEEMKRQKRLLSVIKDTQNIQGFEGLK